MSAPPMGMVASTPKTSEMKVARQNRVNANWLSGCMMNTMPLPAAISSTKPFTNCCPANSTGLPSIFSASLA